VKVAFVGVIPLTLLSIYGQPALRIQYVWNGNPSAPVYSKCGYYTAFDGWKTVRPLPAVNNCPLVAFFPFDIAKLIGV